MSYARKENSFKTKIIHEVIVSHPHSSTSEAWVKLPPPPPNCCLSTVLPIRSIFTKLYIMFSPASTENFERWMCTLLRSGLEFFQ